MTLAHLAATFGDGGSEAFEAGRIVGRILGTAFLGVGVLFGVVKCVQIARRPEASAKAAYALLVALVMWLAASLIGVAGDLGLRTVVVSVVFSVVCFTGSVVAIVLGATALVEVRAAKFRQGKGQAIAALILSGILAGAVLVGFAIGVVSARTIPPELQAAETSHEGEVVTFPDRNFTVRIPARPWQQINPKAVNPLASIALVRSDPTVFFMVIAEKSAESPTSALVAEISKANVARNATSSHVVAESPLDVHGLPGHLVRIDARVGEHAFAYAIWALAYRGHVYQAMTWADVELAPAVETESKTMLDAFDVIEHETDDETPPDPPPPTRL